VASRLPVNEFLFNRAGAPSPFGDDLQFPLPSGALTYRHPLG
jgi:succinate dehydrogenase / fumarate reductase iron-sulfur subunit